MIDNKTEHLGLPLPNEKNMLEDDCPRIAQSFRKLDAHAAGVDKALAIDSAAIGALEDRATATGHTLAAIDGDLAKHAAKLAALEEAGEKTAAAIEAEARIRADADAAHEASTSAHAALFKHLATGSLSPVIGICLAEEGGGAGSWAHVDINGLPVTPAKSYFNHHPIYSAIRRVLVDGQMMQEHTKFYYKAGEIASGPLAGKRARWISPEPLEGFKVFPSFMKAGQEIDHWYCATYQAIDTTPTAAQAAKVLGSRPGKQPFTNVDFPTMQALCRARNKNGVTGFDMWDIYQAAEIQLLALIEAGTSDSQVIYGPGWVDGQWRVVNNVAQFDAKCVDDPTVASASWRGHVGLWGNVWCMVDGLRIRDSDKHYMMYRNDGTKTWIDTGVVALQHAKVGNDWYHAYIKNFLHQNGTGFDLADIFLPAEYVYGPGQEVNATIPDGFWSWRPDWPNNGEDRVCYLGASWHSGGLAGLFACYLHHPPSHADLHIGCRLARA